jgi:hypothetical protein
MPFDGGCIFLKCWEARFGHVPDDGSRWSGFNRSSFAEIWKNSFAVSCGVRY